VLESERVAAGVEAVPAAAVSFTNAVQLTDWATTAGDGEHDIEVDVVL